MKSSREAFKISEERLREGTIDLVTVLQTQQVLFEALVVLSEAHLRQILQRYADYYNKVRTHRSLTKNAPSFRPAQRVGNIASHAILGGLHHHDVRV